MFTATQIALAVFLDQLLGDPRRGHPLAGFGRVAQWVERLSYGGDQSLYRRQRGAVAWAVCVIPLVVVSYCIESIPGLGYIFSALVLYISLGGASLAEHARRVYERLREGDIIGARQQVAMMVSRDTDKMQEPDIARATIESVLENGNDAIFGALFWFALLGAPGAVLYRLSNTLDAMWGYRNKRYHRFGWAAAKIDDLLNWAPAMLTAASYTLLGRVRQAWYCWQNQGLRWKSRNAGIVMASGAGSLNVLLGGSAWYGGEKIKRPSLGTGLAPVAGDIERSIHLVQRSLTLWMIVIILGGWVLA